MRHRPRCIEYEREKEISDDLCNNQQSGRRPQLKLNGAGERKMTSRQTIALITLLMASLRKIRATAQVQNGPDVVGVYDNFNSKWLDPTKWTTGPKTAGAGVLCNVSGKVRAGSYACRCGTPAQR